MDSVPELLTPEGRREELAERAARLPSWDLTRRQGCDLELLLSGGFHPLAGFLGKEDYDSVTSEMRLADGRLWPIPVTLDVSPEFAQGVQAGQEIVLRDPEGVPVAVMGVRDIWTPDFSREARLVYGTEDPAHPAVDYLRSESGTVYLGGPVEGLAMPARYDFRTRRETPNQLRRHFSRLGWRRVVAFQTRNPLHRAHHEMTLQAARQSEANLLLHPVVGMTKPGDIDHFTRVRCYEAVLGKYPASTTHLSLLNLAMRMGGPREAVWHGIIRENHGCTHFIVGRDHAGPGKDSQGKLFYEPYAAQRLFEKHQEEMRIEMVGFRRMAYAQSRAQYEQSSDEEPRPAALEISGTELRRRLDEGLEIPDWFSFPEVVAELRKARPPRSRQGFTVFLTGLSGAGKSSVASALQAKLMEAGGRPVTLLDGDIVRKNLSSELGFSKEHRDINIRRVGYVASEITKNRGIAICAAIAPYASARRAVRKRIERFGAFVEVYVSASLEECERRDRKGLYRLARAGEIPAFTGISDPYEEPESPDLVLRTEEHDIDECAQRVILKLESMGLLARAWP